MGARRSKGSSCNLKWREGGKDRGRGRGREGEREGTNLTASFSTPSKSLMWSASRSESLLTMPALMVEAARVTSRL